MSSESHRVTLIAGDGIGPEVTEAALRVVEAAGVRIEWERVEAGSEVAAKEGTPLPDRVLDSVRRNRVALKGPITTPIGGGFQSANVMLRQALELYASVRPVRSVPGVPARYEGVDLILVSTGTSRTAGIAWRQTVALCVLDGSYSLPMVFCRKICIRVLQPEFCPLSAALS